MKEVEASANDAMLFVDMFCKKDTLKASIEAELKR
jgi:hypothetical protein